MAPFAGGTDFARAEWTVDGEDRSLSLLLPHEANGNSRSTDTTKAVGFTRI
jgi:hypothetical protein